LFPQRDLASAGNEGREYHANRSGPSRHKNQRSRWLARGPSFAPDRSPFGAGVAAEIARDRRAARPARGSARAAGDPAMTKGGVKAMGGRTVPAAALAIALACAIMLAGRDARGAAPIGSEPPPVPDAPQAEIHYAPVENLERIDVGLIDEAGETIDMDAYVLTDFAVIDALTLAAARGVAVRIWRDSSAAGYSNDEKIAALVAAGAELRIKRTRALMHLKSYCVDGRVLRTGAANFSASGEKDQDNDLIILRDPRFCAAFEANFARQWR
jgi:phosphatidylserine/phosphatidylglycerophosphate/cardiolipin synthase-like enzyme